TVAAAWRWTVVARGVGLRVPLPSAVASYYRSQLVNVTVPGGVVGDVERAVRHGREPGGLGVAARSVGMERIGGQVVQLVLTAAVLLLVPSAFRVVAEWGAAALVALVLLATLGAALVVRQPVRGRVGRGLTVAV